MGTLEDFLNRKNQWSSETFGSPTTRGARGPLLHLQKEVVEALDAHDNPQDRAAYLEELADCFFLATDAVYRSGVSLEEFLGVCEAKLAKNKQRTWPKATTDAPVFHVK